MKRSIDAIVLLVCAAASTVALAQAQGPNFVINTYSTNGINAAPSIAMDGTGRFVAVWPGSGADAAFAVYARRYDSAGSALSDQFRVSTSTTRSLFYPSVAGDLDGSFVVVWGDSTANQIYGRRFAAAGTVLGDEFRVSTATVPFSRIAVAASANHGFVVAWQDPQPAILAQRFSSAGARLGDAFRVNTTTALVLGGAAAAMSESGSFLVAWSRNLPGDGDSSGVYAQLFDAAGGLTGSEFRVNTSTAGFQGGSYGTTVSARAGGFVVAWMSQKDSNFNAEIRAQRYDASATPLGGDFVVGDSDAYSEAGPSASIDTDGSFVVAWARVDGPPPSSVQISARRYDSAGAALTPVFRVNTTTTGYDNGPAVAASSGLFTVVWRGYPTSKALSALVGQRYSFGLHGDANGDGSRSVADVFWLINYLFAGGPPPLAPSDANGDGRVDVADVFYLINALFAGGPAPV